MTPRRHRLHPRRRLRRLLESKQSELYLFEEG
jgi:hypothetical protein